MTIQKTYADEFERVFNGRSYRGARFYESRERCKAVAARLRKFDVYARSVVLPAHGTLFTGAVLERYLLMIHVPIPKRVESVEIVSSMIFSRVCKFEGCSQPRMTITGVRYLMSYKHISAYCEEHQISDMDVNTALNCETREDVVAMLMTMTVLERNARKASFFFTGGFAMPCRATDCFRSRMRTDAFCELHDKENS